MKRYKDELIVRKRREKEKGKYQTIEQGMYVGEQFPDFQRQKLNEDGLEMFLPVNMEPMTEEKKKIKYPMEQRPPVIWANEETTVTFTFNILEQQARESELAQIRDNLGILILSIYPHYLFSDKGKVQHKQGACCWTEFLSPAAGGMLYSILYVTILEEKLLLGMFNCPSENKNDWKRIVLQLIATIRMEEKEK